MIAETVSGYAKFAIYGAQVVAYGAYTALKSLYGRLPECFVVSSPVGNPGDIEGVPVRTLESVGKDTHIIIAATELHHAKIFEELALKGYPHVFKLTAHEEHLLMSEYYASIGRFPPALRSEKEAAGSLALYEIRNHLDKPLSNPQGLQTWEIPLQAGAALTDMRIAKILDMDGDNISAKNSRFCEMTAAYWIWKNTTHGWVGTEHYRRHLLVSPDMLSDDVDAILPLPYICFPNALSQFRRFVSEAVKNLLLSSLRELHPDEYEKYLSILSGKYQYTYNLLAARRKVFDSYCAWMFSILEHMERSADRIPEIAATRALAYASEALTSLYFISNADNLAIRHTEKRIFV